MELGELIKYLESKDPNTKIEHGFNRPHSYRGYYEQLSFEPCENTTAGDMLACAKEALGTTYIGYKGGEFKMDKWTDVWLSEWGTTGDALTIHTLEMMFEMAPLKAENAELREQIRKLWMCARELAIMLDRDPDGVEEMAIGKDLDAMCALLDLGD